MGAGDALKDVFENTLLDLKGSELTIYKNWNTESMTSIQTKGIKESKGTFEFKIDTDISTNDVIQLADSRSFWKVVDVDEEVKLGTATNLIVRVTKVDQLGNHIQLNAEGRAVFYGPVSGGVQIGGQGNTQTVTITNTTNPDFAAALNSILDLVKESSLSELDKEDVAAELERLNQLAQKDKTPDVIERAQKKLDLVKSALEVGDLAVKATPYLTAIAAFFGI